MGIQQGVVVLFEFWVRVCQLLTIIKSTSKKNATQGTGLGQILDSNLNNRKWVELKM
jgi:hypothetical protein